MARRRATRGNRYRVAASAVVFVAVMAILEGAARTLGPQVPIWRAPDNPGVVMTANDTRLWGMGEGVRKNGQVTCTIGPLGLRGPAPEVPRPPGRERLLVIGDSSFFGHGIPDDQTIAVQLESALKARGIDVDVVNGAIPGYSTEQTKILLDEVGWSVQPTLLLTGNLWSDNNADGFRDADLLKTAALYHNSLLVHSALFQFTAAWIDKARGGTGAHLVTWTKDSKWPDAKERRVPLQDYATNLDAIIHAAKAHGAGVAFISPANKGLVNHEFPKGAGWDPYFRAQKAVADFHALPLTSAVAALQADPAALDDKFVDQMHPSSSGAGDIARAVADTLVAAGWPQEKLYGKDAAFDASGLVDDATVQPGGQSAKYSPQAQLFPDVVEEGAANSKDPDHTEPGENPGGGGAQTSVATAPNRSPVTGWDVHGTVTGGTGPIKVELQSADGQALGFTWIAAPGPYSLKVRGGHPDITVTATDADGKTRTAPTTEGGSEVALTF